MKKQIPILMVLGVLIVFVYQGIKLLSFSSDEVSSAPPLSETSLSQSKLESQPLVQKQRKKPARPQSHSRSATRAKTPQKVTKAQATPSHWVSQSRDERDFFGRFQYNFADNECQYCYERNQFGECIAFEIRLEENAQVVAPKLKGMNLLTRKRLQALARKPDLNGFTGECVDFTFVPGLSADEVLRSLPKQIRNANLAGSNWKLPHSSLVSSFGRNHKPSSNEMSAAHFDFSGSDLRGAKTL